MRKVFSCHINTFELHLVPIMIPQASKQFFFLRVVPAQRSECRSALRVRRACRWVRSVRIVALHRLLLLLCSYHDSACAMASVGGRDAQRSDPRIASRLVSSGRGASQRSAAAPSAVCQSSAASVRVGCKDACRNTHTTSTTSDDHAGQPRRTRSLQQRHARTMILLLTWPIAACAH